MKLALFTLLAVALCAASVSAGPAAGRIIGGVDALPGEFPEICMIQWVFLGQQSNICACAILNGNHVVTAAHCLTEAPTTGRLEVVGGILDTNIIAPQRQRLGVLNTFIHPEFQATPRANDIAILRLQSPFGFNDWIQPADLPAQDVVASGVVRTAGWGQTGTGILPPSATRLQKIQVPVVPFADCQASLLNFNLQLQAGKMCTGPLTGGIGVCNGDAGGPVMQGRTIVGVVSFTTSPCAAVGGASVHTNISSYRNWINTILG